MTPTPENFMGFQWFLFQWFFRVILGNGRKGLMGACAACDALRAAERRAFVTPYSHGRCEACTARINARTPRCWSCEINPAPRDPRLACRGCVRSCIRAVRRLHEEKEADYRREVMKHEAWIAAMNPNVYAQLLKFDERRLKAPNRGDVWLLDYPPPPLTDRHQASCFMRRNRDFRWDGHLATS